MAANVVAFLFMAPRWQTHVRLPGLRANGDLAAAPTHPFSDPIMLELWVTVGARIFASLWGYGPRVPNSIIPLTNIPGAKRCCLRINSMFFSGYLFAKTEYLFLGMSFCCVQMKV